MNVLQEDHISCINNASKLVRVDWPSGVPGICQLPEYASQQLQYQVYLPGGSTSNRSTEQVTAEFLTPQGEQRRMRRDVGEIVISCDDQTTAQERQSLRQPGSSTTNRMTS